jgi:hypothetical protein
LGLQHSFLLSTQFEKGHSDSRKWINKESTLGKVPSIANKINWMYEFTQAKKKSAFAIWNFKRTWKINLIQLHLLNKSFEFWITNKHHDKYYLVILMLILTLDHSFYVMIAEFSWFCSMWFNFRSLYKIGRSLLLLQVASCNNCNRIN